MTRESGPEASAPYRTAPPTPPRDRGGLLHRLAHLLRWNGARVSVEYPPSPENPLARWHVFTVCATCGEKRWLGLGRFIHGPSWNETFGTGPR
jgi:hypothetical protein